MVAVIQKNVATAAAQFRSQIGVSTDAELVSQGPVSKALYAGSVSNTFSGSLKEAISTPEIAFTIVSTGFQAYAVDPIAENVYITRIISTNPDVVIVGRYDFNGALLDEQNSTTVIGHGAGLAIERMIDGTIRLWSGNAAGNGATRFAYTGGGNIASVENYIFFSGYSTAQPSVSEDGRYVIVQAGVGGVRRMRVFDLAAMVLLGPGDRSSNFLYDWPLNADQMSPPFQGLAASDGKIYTVSGTSSIADDKLMFVYSIDGKLLDKQTIITGKDLAATLGPGTYWEPEGLGWVPTATGSSVLSVGMAMAGGLRIYGYGAGLRHYIKAPAGVWLDRLKGGQLFLNSASNRSIMTVRGGKLTTDAAILIYGLDDPTNPGRIQVQARGSSSTFTYVYDAGTGSFRPGADNSQTNGSSAARWSIGYFAQVRPGAGSAIWTSGTGSPETVLTAPVGSLYTRTDGGASTTLYVKETGSGNTGWVAK